MKRRQHGSVENEFAKDSAEFPTLGMGATQLHWTDRSPYTIIAVRDNGQTIDVQEDTVARLDPKDDPDGQIYRYEPNPKGDIVTVTKRRGGHWIACGDTVTDGRRFVIGHRERYYDVHF